MKEILTNLPSLPMIVYLVGVTLAVVLAVSFALSVRYYMKAKDLVPYLHKIKELAARISELRTRIENAEKELKEKLAEVTHAEKLIQQGKDAENWLREHREEIDNLQKNLAAIRAEFQDAKVHKEDLNRQISEQQQVLIDVNKKVVEADQRVKDAEKAVESIRQENAELTVKIPQLRAEKEKLDKDVQALTQQKVELEKANAECVAKLQKIQGEIERLNGVIAAKKSELESLEKKLSDAKVENKRIRDETVNLEARADKAKHTLITVVPGEKWKNLDTPIINEEHLRNTSNETIDENDWLAEFGKRLEINGFIFDQRAIRAFHTGLKCAKQTPLVVLAGISGTGKSLLPELYASALGMNFLPVPVQPRWDSPQDLFGFYNYMEGRYKATELARLLWQFDWYNGPAKNRYKNGNTLPLNLVLLDEMNLARVEYYFSDLLSKLEIRNGLDIDNEQERKKAEIELECNAADKLDSMRHLFVSPYTLFVGTMNEDESTQTLSDKVIDRSNVLRFGRPKSLGEDKDNGGENKKVKEPDKSAFLKSYEDKKTARISARDWDVWCKTLDDANKESEALRFLHETVTPIATALDAVHRSYGFRVDKAMKLYVMNYPGDYREAVADQIEMKILPKLNGLEMDDPNFPTVKMAMSEAIAATKDEKLAKAFDDACQQQGAAFFKWRGVMR